MENTIMESPVKLTGLRKKEIPDILKSKIPSEFVPINQYDAVLNRYIAEISKAIGLTPEKFLLHDRKSRLIIAARRVLCCMATMSEIPGKVIAEKINLNIDAVRLGSHNCIMSIRYNSNEFITQIINKLPDYE